jgi:hypothetical protein
MSGESGLTGAVRYHFGPDSIGMYLKRYDDVDISKSWCGACADIWTWAVAVLTVLKRQGRCRSRLG